jgi:hypothetical protein
LLPRNIEIQINRSLNLPSALDGCDSWSVKLSEEQRLRVSENMTLRELITSKRVEITEEWRRLHNEELQDLCSSPNIIQLIK